MEGDIPSATAAGACMLRAAHLLVDDDPKIVTDPWAVFFLDDRRRALAANHDLMSTDITRASRSTVSARVPITEVALDEFVASGGAQYVILGAGFDSFGLRRPDLADRLTVFEVDHPATQRRKRAALADGGVPEPDHVRFVPVDFEHQTAETELRNAGWRRDIPTFFSWLGVVMYLTDAATFGTLEFVSSCPRGTTIVVQYAVQGPTVLASDLDIRDRASAGVAAQGEPWINFYEPDVLVSRLFAAGYSEVEDLRSEQLQPRWFAGRRDGLWWPTTNGMVIARV
jgi:methyltransferase (TIGR00027 family)